jgi:hypothetical protein
MKTLFPNARFLTLESENLGRDWQEKAIEIHGHLSALSMDLAEESIFLFYDESPGALLEDRGRCQVARSVIGPWRDFEGALQLKDLSQSAVYQIPLKELGQWPDLFEQCYLEWEKLHTQGQKIHNHFMLVFKRRLVALTGESLNFSAEILFWPREF